jgi:hypothetical protein
MVLWVLGLQFEHGLDESVNTPTLTVAIGADFQVVTGGAQGVPAKTLLIPKAVALAAVMDAGFGSAATHQQE